MAQNVFTFTQAVKEKLKARIALVGPSGSGKTWTALLFAMYLAEREGLKVAVIDTEHGSAKKYADLFQFDTLELSSFSPEVYVKAIKAAIDAGYGVIVIDSLSHAWSGKDGALEQVDKAAARYKGNSFAAWREVTPMHNEMVETMVGAEAHMVVTMRSKTEWVVETTDGGKTQPRKLGMEPVQRAGLEYEFDLVGDMDVNKNTLVVTKTRCPALTGEVVSKPGNEFIEKFYEWLNSGAQPRPRISKEALLQFGSQFNLTGAQIAEALKTAGVSFDPYLVEEMKDAIVAYHNNLVELHQAANETAE